MSSAESFIQGGPKLEPCVAVTIACFEVIFELFSPRFSSKKHFLKYYSGYGKP